MGFFSARRGRIYLPLDELARAGVSEDDIFRGKVTDEWRSFMRVQIQRARMFFDEAEKGVPELNSASRWPVITQIPSFSPQDHLHFVYNLKLKTHSFNEFYKKTKTKNKKISRSNRKQ